MSIYLLAPTTVFEEELTNTVMLNLAGQNISPIGRDCYPLEQGNPPYALVRYDNVTAEQVGEVEGAYVLPSVALNTKLSAIDLFTRTTMFEQLGSRGIDLSAVSIESDDLRAIIGHVGLSIVSTFDLANFTS